MNSMKFRSKGLIYGVVILLIASIVWAYVGIQSTNKAQPVDEVTLDITAPYQITSRKDLTVWPAGTVYPQAMAAYFYAANPQLKVTPKVEVIGMQQGSLNGSIVSEILLQAVNDKSQVYWSYTLSSPSSQPFILSQEIAARANQTVFESNAIMLEIPAAYDLVRRIGEELMFERGELQVLVTSKISISGIVNGVQIEKAVDNILPIQLHDSSFTIAQTKDALTTLPLVLDNKDSTQYNTWMNLLRTNLWPISLSIFLTVVLSILILIDNNNKPLEAIEHKRFKQWITEGNVEVKDGFSIHIFSLEGLVDLAIDLDKRVIYDAKVSKYYVLTQDIVYVYDLQRQDKKMDSKQQLGKLLVEQGLIKPEQLDIAIHYEKKIGKRLGESLMALGFIDEITLYSTLAAQQKVDYYELDATKAITDTSWIAQMSIDKARALMALPLGRRADGKLVIVCSELSKDGVKNALLEMFGSEIYLVAARPSAIYESLERIHTSMQQIDLTAQESDNRLEPFERLSEQEQARFVEFYIRGKISHGLLLKATGVFEPATIDRVMETEHDIDTMRNSQLIDTEFTNLLRSLDRITQAMHWKLRHEKKLPQLMDLLINANYLSVETVEWVNRELQLQRLELAQVLINNYIVSAQTVKNATIVLDTLGSVLYKSPMI